MPSRRKSAHTTKIERVPRYEAYHGEEDIDGDGTLDLSMKRIKVEPLDLEQGGNKVGGGSRITTVNESEPIPPEEAEEMVVVGESSGSSEAGGASAGEVEGVSATSSGETSQGNYEAKSAADDEAPGSDASDSKDHVTSQVNALGSMVCSTGEHQQFVIDANEKALSAGSGLSLFRQSSKGKSVRPFKLYTSSRDLLSGLAQQSGTSSLAAYSVPIALAQVAGAPGTVPLAFASPAVTGVPMIPISAQSSTTAASSTAAAMGAGTATTSTASTSSANTNATKSTSSTTEVHLMTLATEADKILRERHASGESDAFSADSNSVENLSNGESMEEALIAGEEGTVLKIPSLVSTSSNGKGEDSLTLIQKRAVAAAVAAANPQKSKKRRQALPEDLKDNAYWERRRKNNEAAKRSRDARRAKEDQIAIRAALLEQENIRLKIEVTALKEETARLRAKLYGNNNC